MPTDLEQRQRETDLNPWFRTKTTRQRQRQRTDTDAKWFRTEDKEKTTMRDGPRSLAPRRAEVQVVRLEPRRPRTSRYYDVIIVIMIIMIILITIVVILII